jgi:hypothetical protein
MRCGYLSFMHKCNAFLLICRLIDGLSKDKNYPYIRGMKTLFVLIAWFSCVCSVIHGQGKLRNFFKPDSTDHARFLNGSMQYSYAPSPGDFHIGGFYLHGGLNIARFFSKQMIAGFCIDFKPFKGVNYWQPSAAFQADFQQNYTPDLTSSESEAKSEMIRNAIIGTENKQFQGNYFGNIGVQLSPFPQKWGGWMLEIKRGYRSLPIYGYLDDPNIENFSSDFAFYQINKVFTFSLYGKPLSFFTKTPHPTFSQAKKDWKHWIHLGVHYARSDMSNDYFYGLHLRDIVTESFWNTHRIQHSFFVSLGIGLY